MFRSPSIIVKLSFQKRAKWAKPAKRSTPQKLTMTQRFGRLHVVCICGIRRLFPFRMFMTSNAVTSVLAIHDRSLSRRAFLQIGGLALGGLALPRLLAAEAKPLLRDKSAIFLFLHGGPSQIETFDPKMTAQAGVRSITGEVATTIPGVTFGGSFPKLAKLAEKVSIVRSYVPGDAQARHQARRLQGHLRQQSRRHLRARRRHQSSGDRHAVQRPPVSASRRW
jgi:hypothetical protein